jgi:hypothetical protein
MMTSGISPAGMQAGIAVFNVDAVAKAPIKAHDDVVAPIDTSGGDSAETGFSSLKMSHPNLGRNLDLKV